MYDHTYSKWKKWAGSPTGPMTSSPFVERYYASVIRIAGCKRGKTCEIGFGPGYFLNFAKSHGLDIIGLEVNEELLSRARNSGFDVRPMSKINEVTAGSLATVVAFDVLEHIAKKDLLNLFTDVKRILADDGLFIVRFPNGDSPFSLPLQNGDITHVTAIGSEMLRYLAGASGLDIVLIRGDIEVIYCGNISVAIHRLISRPIKCIVNLVLNCIFSPRLAIAYTSKNTLAVMRPSLGAQVVFKSGRFVSSARPRAVHEQ